LHHFLTNGLFASFILHIFETYIAKAIDEKVERDGIKTKHYRACIQSSSDEGRKRERTRPNKKRSCVNERRKIIQINAAPVMKYCKPCLYNDNAVSKSSLLSAYM
jgi:hypothetical protein